MTKRDTIEAFHTLYYDSEPETWAATFWLGVLTLKFPCDLFVYQEIIQEVRPDYIIETGTHFGGSALFMASICEQLGQGHVITIDLADLASTDTVRPPHPRITYIAGSSTAPETVAAVKTTIKGAATVMVILDSDHHMAHVLEELGLYAELVTSGSYLIVEDTNINGHPVAGAFGDGPAEAVESFLAGTQDFMVDRSREKFLVTFNPGGYLRKRAGDTLEPKPRRPALAVVEAQLDEARAEAQRLRAEAERLRAERTAHEAELTDVYASTSWQLSAPLRLIGRLSRDALSSRARRRDKGGH